MAKITIKLNPDNIWTLNVLLMDFLDDNRHPSNTLSKILYLITCEIQTKVAIRTVAPNAKSTLKISILHATVLHEVMKLVKTEDPLEMATVNTIIQAIGPKL